MKFIKFLETHILQDEHRNDPELRTVYLAGEVYEMSDASVEYWIVRKPLEIVDAPAPAKPVAPPPVKEPDTDDLTVGKGKMSTRMK